MLCTLQVSWQLQLLASSVDSFTLASKAQPPPGLAYLLPSLFIQPLLASHLFRVSFSGRLQSVAKLIAMSFLDPVPKDGCVSFPTSTPHPQSNMQVSNTSWVPYCLAWFWCCLLGDGIRSHRVRARPRDLPPATTTSATSYKFGSLPVLLTHWLWVRKFHDLLLDRLIHQGSSQKWEEHLNH